MDPASARRSGRASKSCLGESVSSLTAAGSNPEPPAGKPKRAPKPKLTFELLKDERNGLGYIYANFADDFKKKYKGKGHEASDLKRLLHMYEAWQRALFPTATFDDFLEGVEKIGKSFQVKKEMRDMRNLVVSPLQDAQVGWHAEAARSRGKRKASAEPPSGEDGAPGPGEEQGAGEEQDANIPGTDAVMESPPPASSGGFAGNNADDYDSPPSAGAPQAWDDAEANEQSAMLAEADGRELMDDLMDEFDA